MSKTIIISVTVSILLALSCAVIYGSGTRIEFVSQQSPHSQHSRQVIDRVIIKFTPEEVVKRIRKDDPQALKKLVSILKLPPGCILEESMFAQWVRTDQRNKNKADPGINWSRYMSLTLPAGFTPEKCKKLLENNPMVEYVKNLSLGSGGAIFPNDYRYSEQWYLAGSAGNTGRIYAPEAWDITTGTSAVIVAILDTGLDTNSTAEFAGRIVPGYNFVNGNSIANDDHGHGTEVASILCATTNNNSYGAGIDWNCRIMPIKVLDYNNDGFEDKCADGIDWAVTNGAKIINLSAGYTEAATNLIYEAITNALAHNVIFITITHNYSPEHLSMTFPGTMSEVITVGASDSNGQACTFSLTGPTLDLLAPGTNMYVVSTNGYESYGPANWGSSYAAPQVAGVAALICSLRPELNNQQVADLLYAGAVNRISPTNGWDQTNGWGVLNAYNSLLLAQTRFRDVAITNDGTASLSWGCPPNASNRQPFKIEYANQVTGIWAPGSNIIYEATNAVWADTDSTNIPARFYRVKIKQY